MCIYITLKGISEPTGVLEQNSWRKGNISATVSVHLNPIQFIPISLNTIKLNPHTSQPTPGLNPV